MTAHTENSAVAGEEKKKKIPRGWDKVIGKVLNPEKFANKEAAGLGGPDGSRRIVCVLAFFFFCLLSALLLIFHVFFSRTC